MDLKKTFPLGQKVDVFVTHVHDGSANFFVQLNNEDAGKLDEVMAEIESFISSGGSQFVSAGEIGVGMVYLAQYSEDARWYRARVVAVKAGLCDVYFIDYGNTEQIPLKFLRKPKPGFLNLPPQAFECALEGISKFRGPHFEEAVSTFKSLILEQELSCVTSSINNNVLIVSLFKDLNCRDSILTSLLSQVQRTPQATTIESSEPVRSKGTKKFKTVSFSKDDYIDFCVTDVEDPYSFSCQIVQSSEALLDMMDEIANEYEDLKQGELQLLSSSVGYPCCAKFSEDDAWYRAVITNSSSIASGFLDVKFVDYGNTQTTPVSSVKDLKDQFLELPMQAVDCSLHGIRPENNSSEWSVDAKALFSKLSKNKHIVGLICGKNPNGKYQVKLVDTTGEMDMQVDQILIAAKYAEKNSDNLQSVSSTQNNQGTSPLISPQTISTHESKRPPFPYTKEVLTPGKEEKVLVSSVTSPSLFYCMLYRTSTQLEKLMSDIKRHYSRLGPEDEWLANPSVGDPCCAKFSEDQSWYRALVIDVLNSGKVEVLFIDYGNSEQVPPKSIKRLAPQFSELPCQGIKCSLNRICPKGNRDWRSVDIKTFEELALECSGKLTVIALQDDELYRVELVLFDKGKEINLAESMLRKDSAALVVGAVAQSENLASVTSKKFAKVALNVGGYEDVFVSHVDDPGNFWCQLVKHQDDLNNVMNAIHDYCTSSSDVMHHPSLGLACCAKYSEDQGWYRGTITGIKKNNQVEVHFVDYGNFDQLSLSNLRILKPEFMELPAQAFKCRLEQLDVTTLISFSPEVIDRFCDLTVEKELVAMIGSFDETHQQYLILLNDTSKGNTEDVFDLITPLMPHMSSKELVVPKQEVKPGRREHVCVTTVTGVSNFYCQLMCSAAHLDDMMFNMDAHYKALAPDQEQLCQPKVGSYCVGQYTEDDSWYRAKITGTKNNMFDVVYIDFGNGETLPAARLKKLSQTFCQLPQQAVSCLLAGNKTEWSDSQFVELTLDKMFDMEVVSVENDDTTKVELYCRDTEKPLKDQLTKQQSETTLKIKPSPLNVGMTESVFVALASSISKFYCQFSETADSLMDVMDKMYSYYESIESNQDTLPNPQVGSFCAAKFGEDDGWYRAVVSASHGNSIEVFYIDYGNSEVLSLERVKKLKTEFVVLPAQAIECSLSNAREISDAASKRFLELVSDPEIQYEVKIISMTTAGVCEVDLTRKETRESIKQILIKEGLLQIEGKSMQSKMNSISLTVGESQEGQCGFAASPSQFWFNLNSNVDALNSLLEDMAVYYECLSPSDCVLSSPTVGAYCCGQYSVDQGWYRAKITSVNGSQVEVHFVDFGNSEIKLASSLKVLSEEFKSLPEQAILCSLNQAVPTDSGSTWSENAIQEFTDLIVEKDAIIKVITKLPNNCHVVDLLDTRSSRDLALDVLIDKGFAASLHQNGLRQTSPCQTNDYKPFAITAEEGEFIDISPLVCHSPHDFYCQVLSETNIRTFGQLTQRLQDIYSVMGPRDNTLIKPDIGMPCCAVYAGDDSWNRGKITQVLDGNMVEVFFVDYGNKEMIHINKVKQLLPEFTDLPVQCVHCCLPAIKPSSGSQWSNKACEKFSDLVIHKQLVAVLIKAGIGNKMDIKLFDTHDDNKDINIEKALVKERFAAWICPPQIPTSPMETLDDLKPLKVSSGNMLYITAVDSPESIYCQQAGTEEELDKLMSDLTVFYNSLEEREYCVESVSVGNLCAALFSEDNAWYRAVVEDVSSDKITVRFVDYGNTDTLTLNKIKILEKTFLQQPALSVKCKLSGLKPLGESTSWPKKATEFLENVGSDEGFEVRVISDGENENKQQDPNSDFRMVVIASTGVMKVELRDKHGDLGDRLVKEGLAMKIQQEPKNKEAIKEPTKKPSSPKQSRMLNFQDPDIKVGTQMEIYVTDITTPGQFSCQLAQYGDDLNKMMDAIYDHYGNLDEIAGCLVSPDVGQPCIAIFKDDGSWYRASVEAMTLKDLKVKFVDYGNAQTVEPFEVKQIEPRFMKLPKLAIECTVDSQKSDWSKEETEKFRVIVGEDKRTAEILKEENGKYLVKILQGSECISDSILSKPDKPEIPNQVLQPNQVEDAYVAFLFSSTQICIQLAKHSDTLDEVMATIDTTCRSSNTPMMEPNLEVKTPCCAVFEDGWYRAVIKSKPSPGYVEVTYIDYGNTATVPLTHLRSIPESCLKLPKQAIYCTLNNPELSTVSKEMIENTLMDTLVKAKFIKCDGDQWVVEVKLDDTDVADILLHNAKAEAPKATDFTEQKISANSIAQVYVSHTVSIDEFYLQMSSSTESLDSLGEKLNSLYSGSEQNRLQKIEVGAICCAQFTEDKSWYRSTITALPDDAHVEVQFVDYGNSDVIKKSKVMVLRDEFADLPVLAIKCSLDCQGEQWTEKDSEKFEVTICDQELEGVFILKNSDRWQVRLNIDGTSLVKLLKENQEEKVPVDVTLPQSPSKEGARVSKNSPVSDATVSQSLQDDVTDLQVLSSIKDKEITSGQEFECALSHVGDAGSFYLQMNDEPLLDRVTDMIFEIYPSLEPSQECLGKCEVGTLCCVKFSEDEQWYRAVITELLSETEAKVLFIDFGNSEVTAISSIKKLQPQFYEIPKLAVPCRLDNTKDSWSADDMILLEEKMLEKTLKVKFVCCTESGWNVMVEVDGTCLNSLPEFTAKNQVSSKSYTQVPFTSNKREQVTFLSAESLECIWVQPKITENELSALMNEIAESNPAKSMTVSELSGGVPCLSKFTEDDEWYRAEVIQCKETQVFVKYVDYGNTEQVDINRIRSISPSFLSFPEQAVKFRLEVPESKSNLVLNKLNEEYPEITLEADIVNQNEFGVFTVKLFEDGKDLVQKLIALSDTSTVETKEPVSAFEHYPVVGEEALADAVGVNGINTEAVGQQKQEQNQEPEKEEEFFEAQETMEGSGRSSDSLAETDLPPLAIEKSSNDSTSNSNDPNMALQGLEVLSPESGIINEIKACVASTIQENERVMVDESNQNLPDNQTFQSEHLLDSPTMTLKDKLTGCQEEVPFESAKDISTEFQEEVPSVSTKDAPTESQEEVPSELAKDALIETPVEVPPELTKDALTGTPEEMPSELAKGASTESQEVPSESAEDAPTESQEEVPSESSKDARSESQEEVPSEPPKDALTETPEEVPSDPAKDALTESQEEMPSEPASNAQTETPEEMPSESAKDALSELQEEVLSEPAKGASTESQEEVLSEPAKDAQTETPEEVLSESAKIASTESQDEASSDSAEDAPTESQEEVPSESSKDARSESQEEVPSEPPKDALTETPEEVPSDPAKDALTESQEEMPSEPASNAQTETPEEMPSESAKDALSELQEEVLSEPAKGASTESQEEVLSEPAKDAQTETPEEVLSESAKIASTESQDEASSDSAKDAPTESQEEVPSESAKDAQSESQEEVPSELPKDAPTESQEVSSESAKDASTESQEEVPSQPEKDALTETPEEVPSDPAKDAQTETPEEMPSESAKDALSELQEEVLSEQAKGASTESQEEVLSEPAKDAQTETPEEVLSESAKIASTESQDEASSDSAKDVPTESQEEMPPQSTTEAQTESQEEMPSESAKDALREAPEVLSESAKDAQTETPEEVPSDSAKDASMESQRDAQSLKDGQTDLQDDAPIESPKDFSAESQDDDPSKPKVDLSVESKTDIPVESPKYGSTESHVHDPSKSKEDLPSESPKDASTESQKDLPSQEDIASESPKNASTKSQESSPVEFQEDASNEPIDGPTETSNDATTESNEKMLSDNQEYVLPESSKGDGQSETKLQITPEILEDVQKDFSSIMKKDVKVQIADISCESQQNASNKTQEDVPFQSCNDDSESFITQVEIPNGIHKATDESDDQTLSDYEDCLSDGALEKLDYVLENKPNAVNEVNGTEKCLVDEVQEET